MFIEKYNLLKILLPAKEKELMTLLSHFHLNLNTDLILSIKNYQANYKIYNNNVIINSEKTETD
jgi:hypothetical protein